MNSIAPLSVALLVLLPACSSPGPAESAPVEPMVAEPVAEATPSDASSRVAQSLTPTPWTTRFEEGATVVADHVRIEGPDGLLEHVVVRADDRYFDRQVKHGETTLTQITTRLGNEVPEIRAYLDKWTFAAFQKVTVVEHLADVPVSVTAVGGASFRDLNGTLEEAERLEWVGKIGE